MKKKIVRTLIGGIACAAIAFALTSCGEDNNALTTTETAAEFFTVTYYDGETVLKTERLEAGAEVPSFTPTKDGYKFLGWYGTPNFSHKYDFSNKIDGDLSLFACFKSAQYVEDTRTWYVLGNATNGPLKESKWGANLTEELKLTKKDVEGANVYEITLDLYKYSELQFGINTSWHDQRGAGYLATTFYDGTECLVSAAGLAKDDRKSNIKVAVEGNYTFTLTTNPGEDYYDTEDANYSEANKEGFNYNDFDEITFTYNGPVKGDTQPVEEPDLESYQLIIKGTMTSWEASARYDSEDLKVTFDYTFAAGDEFGFAWFKDATEEGYGTYVDYTCLGTTGNGNSNFEASGNNFKAVNAGTYTIVVEISPKRVVTVNFTEAE